jgi:hypothetical protein
MILLDQSSSMGTGIDWGQTSHWKEAAAGLEHLLNDERNRGFFFGLDPFPDATLEYLERCNDPCCMDPLCLLTPANALRCLNLTASCGRACTTDLPPIVPLGRTPESGPEIIQYMNYSFLPDSNGLTPLIDQLRYYLEDRRHEMPEFYSGDGSSYLLIVSDGAESCQTTGAEGEAEAIAQEIGDVTAQILERHGVMSFAIGFGDTTGTMADQLNAIAENGGTLFQSFFPVSEEGALQEAFDKIAATIVSCVYDIGEPSAAADPDRVNFFFDGQPVGHDPTCMDGWNWTAESTPERPQVEFCGPSCERLMDGLVSQIGAEFGCSTFVW